MTSTPFYNRTVSSQLSAIVYPRWNYSHAIHTIEVEVGFVLSRGSSSNADIGAFALRETAR